MNKNFRDFFWKIIKIIDEFKVIIVFVIMMFFLITCNENSILNIIKLQSEIDELEKQQQEMLKKIKQDSMYLNKLDSDDKIFERYLRENFYFHKPNEDVYIIKK